METTLCATVMQVDQQNIMVCNYSNNQEVLVHTKDACRFSKGNCVCIHFSGQPALCVPEALSFPPSLSFYSCTRFRTRPPPSAAD